MTFWKDQGGSSWRFHGVTAAVLMSSIITLDMLRAQGRNIFFNGGLDKDFFKPWHRELFDSIPIGELWFACDRGKDYERLERIRPLLEGIPQRKLRCYTMIGYDEETLAEAEARIERVFRLGFLPFTQLYQPPTADMPTKVYGADWKAVNKQWCRPAAMPWHLLHTGGEHSGLGTH